MTPAAKSCFYLEKEYAKLFKTSVLRDLAHFSACLQSLPALHVACRWCVDADL